MSNATNFPEILFLSNGSRWTSHKNKDKQNNLITSLAAFEAIKNLRAFTKIVILVELQWRDYPYNGYHLLSEFLEEGIPFNGNIAMYSIKYKDIFEPQLNEYEDLISMLPFRVSYKGSEIFTQQFITSLYGRNFPQLANEYQRMLLL